MAGCGCKIANLGGGACSETFDVTRKLIFVRTYDDTGVKNKISKSDLVSGQLPEAFTDAKLIETPDKRWYPIGNFNGVTEVTGDDVEFTDDFGAVFPITKGSITYEGFIEGASNKLESKINGFNCDEFSVYEVDVTGRLLGDDKGEDLLPFKIVRGTIKGTYARKNISGSTPNRLQVNFTMENSIRFGDFLGIPQDCNGYDMDSISGLQDATTSVTVSSTTELVVSFTTDGGSFCEPRLVEGLLVGDITLTNTTTSSGVVPSSFAENGGVYTLTIPAQTTSDAGSITATKSGFDFDTATFTFL